MTFTKEAFRFTVIITFFFIFVLFIVIDSIEENKMLDEFCNKYGYENGEWQIDKADSQLNTPQLYYIHCYDKIKVVKKEQIGEYH